ncbi:A/G-specific adenine glycosylase [Sediminibacillus albus]|uniref:Adenine DNA glycosylase n=1 Tax=Sediminibacillus albus TaxID=407036 RepID=A0A1G9B359_9BACI|nr:A/G-specific adenine glycosylase [Sediminibacillus albus]SDK33981.1 A/G-specific adenine glycosylase [Sediminibacillus albus]
MKNEQVSKLIYNFNKDSFQADLISWFNKEQRQLPWREDKDPYKIWVSEIMLQQTKVDTVIPYFARFIERFPTLNDLAAAEEQDVLKAWEGLGYYSRARNLQTAVKEVAASYDSKVPEDPKALGSLKGVGPYTKGAILSIAYDQPEPAVDGNVMRVLSRVLMIDEDIAKQKTRRIFEECVQEIISPNNPSAFNQGLMELGALICTPSSPSCLLCPVRQHCKAYAEGVQQDLPIKSKSKKQKKVEYFAFIVKDQTGRYLIEQRPEKGLLANLWQFPMAPFAETDEEHAAGWFEQVYGLKITINGKVDDIKHVFSHLIWDVTVMEATVEEGSLRTSQSKFVPSQELKDYPFPVSHQKMLKHAR